MKKQQGYTVIELFAVIITIALLFGVGSVIVIAGHFLIKFW